MHRSYRLTEKRDAKLENEAQLEPKAKRSRTYDRGVLPKITNIASLDNGTFVEAFKFLNYCQLARNSLVSKKFLHLIRTHRHLLALLYVDRLIIGRGSFGFSSKPVYVKIFNNELSSEQYNEWIVCNNYSKQISLKLETFINPPGYHLSAYGNNKDPNQDPSVFISRVKELNHETWPIFQHFVHLITDPFIYIRWMELVPQEDVFDLLASTIDRSNRGRLQCEKLGIDCEGNSLNLFSWIKEHVRCVNFRIFEVSNNSVCCDKQLLDFFTTGSDCASDIFVTHSHISKDVIIELVQKFIRLKNCDESHMVECIRGNVSEPTADALKSDYEKFFIKEEKDHDDSTTAHVFKFVNADVGKKLQLTVSLTQSLMQFKHQVILKIINL